MDKNNRERHPSYAMMGFSRSSRGGAVALFGSSIQHSETITLRISQGKIDRCLNKDWYHGGNSYIEVEMSYSQFAEAISSMNVGAGVPVTLRSLNGQRIEDCPFIDKRQQFQTEFSENIDSAIKATNNLIDNVKQLFENKKHLVKSEKEQILDSLSKIRRELNDNMPFAYEQFNRQMDKTVNEAKGEVESFVQNKINDIAIAAIGEKMDISTVLNSMKNHVPALTVSTDSE